MSTHTASLHAAADHGMAAYALGGMQLAVIKGARPCEAGVR